MASGWVNDGAIQDQIRDSIEDEIKRIQSRLHKGESLHFCEYCDEEIPDARREALRGVRLCITCQEEDDQKQHTFSPYNRRGSKDSQLR